MAEFLPAHNNTSTNEGGWVKNRADRGGETYCGIAREFHEDWEGWEIIDQYKGFDDFPENIPQATLAPFVDEFYKEEFWNKIKGDDIPQQEIANYLYDIAVNKSPRSAIKYLQTACNISNREGKDWSDIEVDGISGANTLKALASWTDKRGIYPCIDWLHVQILSHWQNQALQHPGQETFINGIMDRHLRQIANLAKQYYGIN